MQPSRSCCWQDPLQPVRAGEPASPALSTALRTLRQGRGRTEHRVAAGCRSVPRRSPRMCIRLGSPQLWLSGSPKPVATPVVRLRAARFAAGTLVPNRSELHGYWRPPPLLSRDRPSRPCETVGAMHRGSSTRLGCSSHRIRSAGPGSVPPIDGGHPRPCPRQHPSIQASRALQPLRPALPELATPAPLGRPPSQRSTTLRGRPRGASR